MIQRIQSIYLLLAFVLNGTIFFNVLYDHAQADPQAWIGLGFTIVLILAGLISFISIFLYSNRNTQIRTVTGAIISQIIAFGYATGILISLGGFGAYLWDEALGTLFLFIALAATILARKKIRDDRDLVRSMDRIR